jgi:DNA-binding SARP family transcriptional activator/TolB-like protein
MPLARRSLPVGEASIPAPHRPDGAFVMISFRTLGSLDLVDGEGRMLAAVLAGPKRAALLSYLALARPRGFQRRDVLVALLWPELDQERARAALRHTLHHLRRSLGPDAIRTRGDDEVALDPVVVCDAAEFERLLDAGDPAAAMALYRGPLLDGFFVPEAEEFEKWVERERSRLHQRAAAAAWELAAIKEREGQLAEAGSWARQGMLLAPDDERGLRTLMQLLERSGDKAGAINAYETFARRLASEYDAEPSDETRALAARLRTRSSTPVRQVAPAVPAPGPAPAHLIPEPAAVAPPRAEEPPPAPAPRRSVRRFAAVGAAAVVILIAAALFRRGDAAPRGGEGSVAVFPFTVRGSHEYDYLAEGITDLLSVRLEDATVFVPVDPRRVVSAARAHGGTIARPEDARPVVQRLGARYFVLGSIVEAGGRLQLLGSLYDADGTERATVQTPADDPRNVFQLVDTLARQLLAGEARGASAELTRLAGSSTGSLPALKSYLEGERDLRLGHYAAAVGAFNSAVAADSTFALAYYRLGAASHWVSDLDVATASMERAVQLSDRLPQQTRRLLQAGVAWRTGRYAIAESLYAAVTTARPGNVDAWFSLGDLRYHANALMGRSRAEARPPLERALALDPTHGEARTHLLELAAWDARARDLDTLLAGLDSTADFAQKWPVLRALVSHDSVTEARERAVLRATDDRTLSRLVIHALPSGAHNPTGAIRLVDLLTEPSRPAPRRAYGHILAAQLELTRGRWHAVEDRLIAAAELEPAVTTEIGAMLASMPFAPLSRERLAAMRTTLEGWQPAGTPPTGIYAFAAHDSLHPAIRSYLIGRLSERLGDSVTMLREAGELEHGTSQGGAMAAAFARSLRARVLRMAGRPADALATLGTPWLGLQSHRFTVSPLTSLIAERWLRAELLAQLKRYPEAMGAYAAAADYSVDGLSYLAPSHLARAGICERMGDRACARDHVAAARVLWKEADPAFHLP